MTTGLKLSLLPGLTALGSNWERLTPVQADWSLRGRPDWCLLSRLTEACGADLRDASCPGWLRPEGANRLMPLDQADWGLWGWPDDASCPGWLRPVGLIYWCLLTRLTEAWSDWCLLSRLTEACGADTGFYTKGRPLVKSNLICPSDKLSWQPGCPILNINVQGNFCISQGNVSSDNLPENLV